MHRDFVVDRIREHSFIGGWLDPADTVVDLGMNEGEFSRLVQSKYGCGIIGVEANPVLASKIAVSKNFFCLNRAVDASPGTVELFVDPDNLEATSKLQRPASEHVYKAVVESITPAELVRLSDHRIGLIKMDIEGAEIDVLGSQDLSWLDRVEQVTVEFHAFLHLRLLPDVRAILRRMREYGFYWIDFTTKFADVLFINERVAKLTAADKFRLETAKYRRGGVRVTNRIFQGCRMAYSAKVH